MELRTLMRPAADATIGVVRAIPPGRLADPTPCPEYDVRTLLNHLIYFTAVRGQPAAAKQPVSDDAPGQDHDFTAEAGWTEWYATRARRTAQAWSDPAAWEGVTSLSGGDGMPATFVGGILFAEFLLHGWDLAAATGVRFEVGDAVVLALYERVAGTAEMARQYNVFGPEVPVPSTAPLLDRALGLAGRDPAWPSGPGGAAVTG